MKYDPEIYGKFVELRDDDGHRYRVPIERAEEFDTLMQAIWNSKFGTDEWYDANDNLDATFGEFMF